MLELVWYLDLVSLDQLKYEQLLYKLNLFQSELYIDDATESTTRFQIFHKLDLVDPLSKQLADHTIVDYLAHLVSGIHPDVCDLDVVEEIIALCPVPDALDAVHYALFELPLLDFFLVLVAM